MAIKQDTIDATDGAQSSAGRRALLVVAALAIGGASWWVRRSSSGQGEHVSAAPIKNDSAPLTPDHEGAASFESTTSSQGPMHARAHDGVEVPPDEDQLIVTEPPAAIPASPQELSPRAKFEQMQEEQLYEHLLKVQRQQFEMRERAMRAPSRVQEYAEAVQAQTAQGAQLLAGLGTEAARAERDGTDETAEPLRAIAAMRARADRVDPHRAPSALARDLGGGEADPELDHDRDKLAFFQNGGTQLEPGRLTNAVQHPKAPYELRMGTVIPGVLVTGMNSEAPGQIVGQVTEDVLDSVRHEQVLIPQGSQVVGTYSASISEGQSRIQVAWVRLNFPNGTYLDLGGMSGADQAGTAGFHDRVNRHFAKRLAAALMSSAFTVALKLTEPPGGNRIGDAIHRGVGESVVQLGVDLAREQGRIPPTLEIRPGYRFRIMVSKDIGFSAAYKGRSRARGRHR